MISFLSEEQLVQILKMTHGKGFASLPLSKDAVLL